MAASATGKSSKTSFIKLAVSKEEVSVNLYKHISLLSLLMLKHLKGHKRCKKKKTEDIRKKKKKGTRMKERDNAEMDNISILNIFVLCCYSYDTQNTYVWKKSD